MAAVLFDMDGVLIDTERLCLELMIETGKKFGYTIDPSDVTALRSTAQESCSEYYRNKYGENFDYYAIREERQKSMREYIDANGLTPKKGVVKALRYLKAQRIETAVVTSTQYDCALNYLKISGLDVYFDKIISVSMVKNGKPEPDVYLYAASIIEEDPRDCIAVEDSPKGVCSAFKAGCKVAIIPDLTQPDETMLKMGTWVLDSADELIGVVNEFVR